MKKLLKYYIILFLGLFLSISVLSQNIQTEVSLKSDSIIIGQPTDLLIQVSLSKNIDIIFPNFKDTISKKIEVLKENEVELVEYDVIKSLKKSYLITSFDTGLNVIPAIQLKIIEGVDTSFIYTKEQQFFVKPYVLLDTIPVDTVYADHNGFIVFGKDGFKAEIEKYIPDSIKNSVSIDSLNQIKAYIHEQLFNVFSSELTKNTGLYNQEEIKQIAEASSQKMFLVNKGGILSNYIVAGSVDTVFVQDYQQVQKKQPLFTLFRIKDIKENMFNTPFNFAEFWYYFKKYLAQYWWALLILLILSFALVYFFKYYKKGVKPILFRVKPEEPAHIIALAKLENIRKEKIWSKGQVKEYHVQISTVIREYVEKRFGVFAIEMTTNEILDNFENLNLISETDLIKLRQILDLADSVKFAKYQALQNENDFSLKNSFDFVENTKELIPEDSKLVQTEAVIEIIENVDKIENKEQDDVK